MSENRFSDTPETESKIRWHRVPGMPDMLRADDWCLVIRRVWDDGATLYQLFDSSPMLNQDAPMETRCAWRLLGWHGCGDGAKAAAEDYRRAQAAKAEE